MPMPCWLKTPWLHQSFGPCVFLSFPLSIISLFLSLYFWLIPWSMEARWAHFLARASKTLSRRHTVPSPTREGSWCLHAAARAVRTGLYGFPRKPGDISHFISLTLGTTRFRSIKGPTSALPYFLIIDSGPPGSSPLKDQKVAPEQGLWYTWQIPTEWPPGPIEAIKY